MCFNTHSQERVAKRRDGWVVQTAWPSLGTALETPWLALGGPLLSSYAWMGWENSPLTFHGAHFWQGSLFPIWTSCCRPRAGDYCKLLMGGCSLSHKRVEDSCKSTCVKFGGWKPDRTGGYGKFSAWIFGILLQSGCAGASLLGVKIILGLCWSAG